MRAIKPAIFAFALLLALSSTFAFEINSSNYKQRVIVSSGGETTSSSSYKIINVVGTINSIISSPSYTNRIGFLHTLLLADGQPCTSANQCEGGFCCSGSCTSSACPSGAAGGGGGAAATGGGGGDTPLLTKNFSVTPTSIDEQLALGESRKVPITMKNTGNFSLNFSLSVSAAISEFVTLSETAFSLAPAQEKVIDANIAGKKLGSYFGTIETKGDGISKSVDVVLDISSEQVLFDAKIDIPPEYKEVEPGKDLKAQITLLNVGPAKQVDVTISYIIKDKSGNVMHESSETIPVESQLSFVKTFKIPENFQPGDYIIVIEVRYQNTFAVSSDLFKVVAKEEAVKKAAMSRTIVISGIVFAAIILIVFAYLLIPRFSWSVMLTECRMIMDKAKSAIISKDIPSARKLYMEARSIYRSLSQDEKREVYGELMDLYNKLK
ncbi:hypothetical protein J4204_03650 [Candidatus Woesearchaeota archaeon]|nr:hypothetical protein [Candidatus Woesearchaeota archaeon]